jgi:hypothetical protein
MTRTCILLIILLIFLITILDKGFEPFESPDKTIIMWFYRPGCPHCDRMAKAWDDLKNTGLPNTYVFKEIDTGNPKNSGIASKYNVSGVPYIIKEKNNNIDVYHGDRSTSDMRSWILS